MFIGHYAVALAAKRAAPRTSLGWMFVAAQWADGLWPILLLLGMEHVEIVRDAPNSFLTLRFTDYPWSHSLVADVVWGVLMTLLYVSLRRDKRGAIVLGLLVVSHWVLDWVTHVPDMPLWPGGPRYGLGLWRSPAATVVIEGAMFVLGVLSYFSQTRARDRIGRWGAWSLIAVLAVLYVASLGGGTPPTVQAVAWTALIAWLIPLWAWWADHHRDVVDDRPREPAAEP